jgi:hypothetical protein
MPPATVVMEACGSAHYWARRMGELGHEVVLLPPHQVRPYVTRNKTGRTDAKGILEAYRNADIRPVPVKSILPQVLGSLHRFRAGCRLRSWALALEKRVKHNKAAVALANKLARIVRAVWKHTTPTRPPGPRRRSFEDLKEQGTRIEKTRPTLGLHKRIARWRNRSDRRTGSREQAWSSRPVSSIGSRPRGFHHGLGL